MYIVDFALSVGHEKNDYKVRVRHHTGNRSERLLIRRDDKESGGEVAPLVISRDGIFVYEVEVGDDCSWKIEFNKIS